MAPKIPTRIGAPKPLFLPKRSPKRMLITWRRTRILQGLATSLSPSRVRNLALPSSVLSSSATEDLVQSLLKSGMIDDAVSLLTRVPQTSSKPPSVLFCNLVLSFLTRARRFESTVSLYRSMRRSSVHPDVATLISSSTVTASRAI